jgi:hypothetical protein
MTSKGLTTSTAAADHHLQPGVAAWRLATTGANVVKPDEYFATSRRCERDRTQPPPPSSRHLAVALSEVTAGARSAPHEIHYDRMKTAVIGEDADGRVVDNRSLVELARHLGPPRLGFPFPIPTVRAVVRRSLSTEMPRLRARLCQSMIRRSPATVQDATLTRGQRGQLRRTSDVRKTTAQIPETPKFPQGTDFRG